ncbi:MAG: c-type cytochrome [Kofleriaceae bacterium]
MQSLLVAVLLAFLSLGLGACGKGDKPPPPTSGSPNAKTETGPSDPNTIGENGPTPAQQAKLLFDNVCATCHGIDGSGNGPAAESLNPKPRNYTDAAWQSSVTDEELKKIIVEGGQAVGKSGMMPGQPQLKDQPQVLNEIVKLIRSFGKK